ncbi:MAG: hypothetical protein LQ338_000368 [Usnochroma carphineum]|nr:MAG: hypothetical protein LQ338_000368 [Usnochroma carphineum]
MVKFYEGSFKYDYPFQAVSLAYFLRYPNPYAKHVLSTDVIDRHFDPDTRRLYTTRLHLKRSKLPPTVLKLLPKGILGSNSDTGQSYILEKSIVDVREGWMTTETKNLEWTGILSVIEKQCYRRPDQSPVLDDSSGERSDNARHGTTEVTTSTTFVSRFGQNGPRTARRKAEVLPPGRETAADIPDDNPPKKGFLSNWSTSSLQRTIEVIGMRRTREALLKSKDGMNVVLGRLRSGGLVEVLEGMRRDREAMFGPEGPWKRAWKHGNGIEDDE